jgi:nucleotide-binding universal stress UspA family protein
MQLRDLLVVLDGSPRREAVLAVSVALAQRHNAHLTGFCPLELLLPVTLAPAIGAYPQLSMLQEAAEQIDTDAAVKARAIEAEFREELRRCDVRGDWQVVGGSAIAAVAHRTRTADLVVLGQAHPDYPFPATARHLVEDVLMQAGRPLLLVPFAGCYDTLGNNVLIGWNGSRESARAVHDALPLIAPGATVTVLTIEHARGAAHLQDVPAAEMAEHLSRHGLKVSAARTVADRSISDSDVLLAYASDSGADMLVIGGYGHSRAREMILGGVSRSLLAHMTLPVLMSH